MAKQTLDYFSEAVSAAEAELAGTGRGLDAHALVSINTFNGTAHHSLSAISTDVRRILESVIAQPAIARVEVLTEVGERQTIFITPGGAPRARMGDLRTASYRSPAGRLASLPIGSELEVRTPSGPKVYELVGRERLNPERGLEGWDGRDTVVEALHTKPLTVRSLRALLRAANLDDDDLALLDRLLSDDIGDGNVTEGIRRAVLEHMGLRLQPALDQYQDEIFRLPLDRRLVVLGPPGSGKTTTLVKRLGLKLDLQALEGDDRTIASSALAGLERHADSWLMFSPTELLRLYVKEAFNRERVPAADHQVEVWDSYRRTIARNQLSLLRNANNSGFTLTKSSHNIQVSTFGSLTQWYDDFDAWQHDRFWSDLRAQAERVGASSNGQIARLGARLVSIADTGALSRSAGPFQDLRSLSRELGENALRERDQARDLLRRVLAKYLSLDPQLLDKINNFLRGLGVRDASDEPDDQDGDDDEDEVVPARGGREAAFGAFVQAVRTQARALTTGRRLGSRTRHGQLIEWLANRVPNEETLQQVGTHVALETSLRRLANPLRGYQRGLSGRYRLFRRIRLGEGKWYEASGFRPSDIGPLELDMLVLATLRGCRMLLRDRSISATIGDAALIDLRVVRDLFRTQILIDEATDFSPIQLACMAALCDPATNSLFACGDFHQRITEWGCRTTSDLNWVAPNIEVRTIRVTYRHTRQLNALAHRLARLTDDSHEAAALPEHVDKDGVDPVLGRGLSGDELVTWLAHRILEIERLTTKLPSIAILVNREEEVQALADALEVRLSVQNIHCAACHGGQVRGSEQDVRVFDVQHIKGLEFEAVFFVAIDELARIKPTLFDKFLFVGTTRAAMYLGLTTAGLVEPQRLSSIIDAFGVSWS